MSIVALTAVCGSPGVSTTAVGLALCWPRPVMLVEADPTGGSSILVTCVGMGLLLRVSWELERARRQVALRRDAVMPTNSAATSATSAMPVSPSPAVSAKPMREAVNVAADMLTEAGERTRNTLARLLERAPKAKRSGSPARRERVEPSFGGASGR